MNPAATAAADVGFGQQKGSVQYVNLSDIKSGKVKLPEGAVVQGMPPDGPKVGPGPSRGFGSKPALPIPPLPKEDPPYNSDSSIPTEFI